ncbi:hypothetical protein [Streptomyces sp. 6N106]|uniref:hypothetical protein n=1 Tax=Streptomyces sp. 6N106 TaxID=3457418 RepID=UPI003FD51AE4
MDFNAFGEQETPAGRSLPKAAVELINVAALGGWTVGWRWGRDNGDNDFITVHVGDRDSREYFKYTWHSRGTGTLRLFSKMHRPAGKDVWTDGPSLKAALHRVREVAALVA